MNRTATTALIIGGIVVAVLVVLPLVSGLFSGGQGYYGGGMMGGMMGGFGGWGWGMGIGIVLFWGLVIWGIVALVGGLGRRDGSMGCCGHDEHSGHSDSALDVLKRRYAQGEIDKEEYEQKKRDLA